MKYCSSFVVQSTLRQHIYVDQAHFIHAYGGASGQEVAKIGASRLCSYLWQESVSMCNLHFA